jgi:hypothetical protein
MTQSAQAALSKELGFWPATAKGWTWTWQRCGRYEHRKCLTHSTYPGQLVPRGPSPTTVSPLRIAGRYAMPLRLSRRQGCHHLAGPNDGYWEAISQAEYAGSFPSSLTFITVMGSATL